MNIFLKLNLLSLLAIFFCFSASAEKTNKSIEAKNANYMLSDIEYNGNYLMCNMYNYMLLQKENRDVYCTLCNGTKFTLTTLDGKLHIKVTNKLKEELSKYDITEAYFYTSPDNTGKFDFKIKPGSAKILSELFGKNSTISNSTSTTQKSNSQPSQSTTKREEPFYFTVNGVITNQYGKPISACYQDRFGNNIITTGSDGKFTLNHTSVGAVYYFFKKGEFAENQKITITRKWPLMAWLSQ